MFAAGDRLPFVAAVLMLTLAVATGSRGPFLVQRSDNNYTKIYDIGARVDCKQTLDITFG